jgi:hypothetical protein
MILYKNISLNLILINSYYNIIMSFDIVIPLGPNEVSNIHEQILYTKKNIIGYRNIYIVTLDTPIEIDNCIIIDECIFPFKEFISSFFAQYNGKHNRNGWYFQQLIKLYAGIYIPNILDNYLVLDADVFFLKPTIFMENNKPIFSTGTEYHIPYFTHMNLLHNSLTKVYNKSGICHHMLFNKQYIDELFNIVEDNHKIPFWQAFILNVIEHKNHNIICSESGASEYEIYFNYLIKYHSNDIIIRDLCWKNICKRNFTIESNNLNNDYISVCNWMG